MCVCVCGVYVYLFLVTQFFFTGFLVVTSCHVDFNCLAARLSLDWIELDGLSLVILSQFIQGNKIKYKSMSFKKVLFLNFTYEVY